MTFTVRGIEFNDERLAKLTIECLDELAVIGLYPCKVESVKLRKQDKKFGCCHTRYKKATNEVIHNRITINRRLIDENATDKTLKEVITHELCHAMEDCLTCGHDGKWAEYAELINDCYNMEVQQYGSYERYGIEKNKRNIYECKCKRCGKIMRKQGYRAPKWYVHPENFHHNCDDGGTGAIFPKGVM